MSYRSIALTLATIVLALNSIQSAWSQNPTNARTPVILVISASSHSGRVRMSEFIVLRESAGKIEWSASAFNRKDNVTGTVTVSSAVLADAFDRVSGLASEEAGARHVNDATGTSYSLLLIDRHGRVRSCPVLSKRQQEETGKQFRSTFDVILKEGPYAKANIMLDLLLPPGALRATTKARRLIVE